MPKANQQTSQPANQEAKLPTPKERWRQRRKPCNEAEQARAAISSAQGAPKRKFEQPCEVKGAPKMSGLGQPIRTPTQLGLANSSASGLDKFGCVQQGSLRFESGPM